VHDAQILAENSPAKADTLVTEGAKMIHTLRIKKKAEEQKNHI
jgi:hypothetical protein